MSPDILQKTEEFRYRLFTEPAFNMNRPLVFSISFVLILSFLRVLRVDGVACQ